MRYGSQSSAPCCLDQPLPARIMPIDLHGIGQPILIASHPRSGTHLTIDVLRRQFQACASWKYPGETLDRLYLPLEGVTASHKGISLSTALRILKRPERPLLKTHAYPALAHLAGPYQDLQTWVTHSADRIYVVRDGRAVLCSLHLFMQSYDPATRCSLSDFLRQQVNGQSRVKIWANHVQNWLAQPNLYCLKFEDLIHAPYQTLNTLGKVLTLQPNNREPILPRSPRNIWQGRWARLTQMRPESTAIIGFYRGQQTQKWQAAFTECDRKFFHQEAGDILIKLGYIDSEAWVTAG